MRDEKLADAAMNLVTAVIDAEIFIDEMKCRVGQEASVMVALHRGSVAVLKAAPKPEATGRGDQPRSHTRAHPPRSET